MSEKIIETNELENVFDPENCTVAVEGEFGIHELAGLLCFLKRKKQATVEPAFKIGSHVQRVGYSYEHGEVTEIDIDIGDDGDETITYMVESCGSFFESELELFNPKISHEYPY